VAIKKSDLYSSLWASCDELRGGMDASQYKDYVLFMLFIKYITDKYGNSNDFAPPETVTRFTRSTRSPEPRLGVRSWKASTSIRGVGAKGRPIGCCHCSGRSMWERPRTPISTVPSTISRPTRGI
jgi:hypothetical protein